MYNFLSEIETAQQYWWPYIVTLVISIVAIIRLYIGGAKCPSKNRMDGKTVIITGGSSGIGLATAKQLAERGAKIILGVRNAEKGKQALKSIKELYPETNALVKIIDLTDMNSIREFVNQIQLENDKIDVLINNAGIIFHPFKQTIDGHETTIATNYLGHFLLTHLLLPLLARSDNARVINLSAMAHVKAKLCLDNLNSEKKFAEMDAFGQSKVALTMWTKEMASLLKHSSITFNAVNPGLVRGTGHLRNSKLTRFPTNISVMPWMFLFMKTPKQGCQTVLYAAVEPSLNNVSGCYFSNCEIQPPNSLVNDVDLRDKLYKETCKLVNIKGEEYIKLVPENYHTIKE